MKTCAICFEAAMNHGGNLVAETFAWVRHWRPQTMWPPTPMSQTRKPLPGTPDWFCVTHEIRETRTLVKHHSSKSMAVPYGTG